MKLVIIGLLLCVSLGLTSCTRTEKTLSPALTAADTDSAKAPGSYRLEEPRLQSDSGAFTGGSKVAIVSKPVAAQTGQPSELPIPVVIDRKIIRNGEFTIESRNPTEDQNKIQAIAESLGGFVVTSEFQQSSDLISKVNVVVRVPSGQFQTAKDKISAVGNRVLHGKVSGQDVTEEYVDLEAQLRAKKALEAQFLEIMKQAKKVEDALSVQEKLSEVRTEIERLEGRRRYLENQAALSTINITLQTPAPLVATSQNGFWSSIKSSFGDSVDVSISIVLGLIHFVIVMLPVFLLILLPTGLLLRYLGKRLGWGRFFKKGEAIPQAEG